MVLNGSASLGKYLRMIEQAGSKPRSPKLPLFGKLELEQCVRMISIMEDHELRVARQDMINCINLNPDYIIFDDTDFDHLHDMCNEFVANGAIKKAPVLINSTYGSQHIVFSTI